MITFLIFAVISVLFGIMGNWVETKLNEAMWEEELRRHEKGTLIAQVQNKYILRNLF